MDVLTVQQLNERVRSILADSRDVRDVWVAGEISNLTKHGSGHYYFTLKDAGSEIRCSLFRGARQRVGFEPNNNMKVVAFGRTDLYVQRGSYQFIVDTMRMSGVGDLYAAYEALKRKLESDGLFDASHKKPIPKYPMRVGVVTSPTGAAIHDILNVSGRRFPSDIVLYPALVQGDGAARSIVNGIRILNEEDVDVIIIGRGGGSIEDLWAFNEEIVAKAIFDSRIPIISAVGHETDFTIADLVADVRAATPSAAAEIALPDKAAEMHRIDALGMRLDRSLGSVVRMMRSKYMVLDAKLSPKRAMDTIAVYGSRLDSLSFMAMSSMNSVMDRVERRFALMESKLSPRRAKESVEQYMIRLDDLADAMDSSMTRAMRDYSKTVESMSARLDSLNPMAVLGRGYTMITDIDGKPLTSTSSLKDGMIIGLKMRDGAADAEIKGVRRHGEHV